MSGSFLVTVKDLMHSCDIFFKEGYFYFLFVHFSSIVFLVVLKRNVFLRAFANTKKFHLILVLIAFLSAFYIRAHYFRDGIIPQFFTEQLSVANSFFYSREASMCNLGQFDACISSGRPIHPGGFAFLIWTFFALFGNSYPTYVLCSAVWSSLAVPAIYFLAVLLLDDSCAGVIASFIFAFLPQLIMITDLRPVVSCSILWIMLSIITLLVSRKHADDRQLCFLSFLTLFFAANMRYENIGLIFVFAVAYGIYRPAAWRMGLKYLLISAAVSLPVFIMHVPSQDVFLSMFGRESVIGGAFHKLLLNLSAYSAYWSTSGYFYRPLYLFLAAGFLLLALSSKYRRVIVLVISWVLIYAAAYLFHKNIGYTRYAMHLFPQYALITALGMSHLIRLVTGWHQRIPRYIPHVLLAASVTVVSLKLSGFIYPPEASVAGEYAPILSGVSSRDYIITDDANSMVFFDRNFAIFNYGGYKKDFLRSEMKKGAGIYLLAWDRMCERYADYAPNCNDFFADFSFFEVAQIGRYTLYKAL